MQRTYRPLQITCLWTQTRSWAPSGPVRIQSAAKLRTRHRAGCLVFPRQKILIFHALGTENIDFWCSRDKNIDFWCSGNRKILIFGVQGTENIDFWCSGGKKF